MTGYQSKKAAALDEEGMYLVHHTQSAQKPVGFIDSKLNPIKNEWVGLTDEEIADVANGCRWSSKYHTDFAHAIEAKLKEKNT